MRFALVLAVLWHGARLVFQPDAMDLLRRADALFVAGRYHDALAAYTALTRRAPRFAPAVARRGMVEAVRGDYPAAGRSLAAAMGLGLRGSDRDLARLYQGYVAAATGLRSKAGQFWAAIGARSALYPYRLALEGETRLWIGDYANAEATYRAALLPGLAPEWHALIRRRLVTLRAAYDPDGALQELAPQPGAAAALPTRAPLVAPLLPPGVPDTQTLAAALRADRTQRPQLLGQIYLGAGLYGLAAAQFAAVAPDSPHALAATTYAAYTRWLTGDQAGGRQRLEAIVAAHPDEPRARALLALTYIAARDQQRAQAQLATIRELAPRAPDTHLAWGQWYAAQADYVAAAEQYRRALDDAPPARRGTFALALARFQLDTPIRLCEDGRPAAEEATRALPTDAQAWTVLAAVSFRCGDPAGARSAANTALRYDPGSAEATYYLGRALAALGDRAGARAALVAAADLAPSSPWRARAEIQLNMLGL